MNIMMTVVAVYTENIEVSLNTWLLLALALMADILYITIVAAVVIANG
jgi:hypothetical protein